KSREISVKTTSIEEFMKKYSLDRIDLLKIDCEGSEYKILFKCPKEIIKKISKITMEYHPIDKSRNAKTLKKFLEKNGFKVRFTRGDSWMLYAKR
ncbi:TPA: FkbM family methyltransferase, partial [bacterium]|nr:FkbM family methyltransferase [bacterium]